MADRTHSERINFGKLREVLQPPNLIEIQITSYLDFLQKGTPEKQRKPQGLEAVFREVFPIQSYDERLVLEYVSYTLGEPKNTEIECIREGDKPDRKLSEGWSDGDDQGVEAHRTRHPPKGR